MRFSSGFDDAQTFEKYRLVVPSGSIADILPVKIQAE